MVGDRAGTRTQASGLNPRLGVKGVSHNRSSGVPTQSPSPVRQGRPSGTHLKGSCEGQVSPFGQSVDSSAWDTVFILLSGLTGRMILKTGGEAARAPGP